MWVRPHRSAEDRFARLLDPDGPLPADDTLDGRCVPFLGARSPNGTGRFKLAADVEIRAHRFAWQSAHGPLEAGVRLINRCGLMNCCNTQHWAIGDAADALLVRAAAEARTKAGRVASRRSRRLSPEQVWAVRRAYRETAWTQREIAAMFTIGQPTVSMICSGKLQARLVEPVAAPVTRAARSLTAVR